MMFSVNLYSYPISLLAWFIINFLQIIEDEKSPSVKLSKLPVEISSKFDNNHLDYINKLCELWHKGQNAVAIDEQVSSMNHTIILLFRHLIASDLVQNG